MDGREYASSNRRQELRYRGRCRRVIWRRGDSEPTPGVLCDFSASGASFMLSQRGNIALHPGEHIVLKHANPDAESNLYQVKRVEHVGLGYVVAGCCRAIDVQVVGHGVRLGGLKESLEPPHAPEGKHAPTPDHPHRSLSPRRTRARWEIPVPRQFKPAA